MQLENRQWLKSLLENAYQEFIASYEHHRDAIEPALHYKYAHDREVAAFISASLAYGRVAHIQNSARRLLDPLGAHPSSALASLSWRDMKDMTHNWSHRFNTAEDACHLLWALKVIYETYGGLEALASAKTHTSMEARLESFVDSIETLLKASRKLPRPGSKFWFLLPRPSSGSACKRLNLFMRWMVGRSAVDLGLWKSIPTRDLVIPLDTHVLRQARRLQLTRSKAATWKTALEITEKLRLLDPEDPTRFDFALCHLGIHGKYLSRPRRKALLNPQG
jgi:uncharacterized protein (TIGR02757 family)